MNDPRATRSALTIAGSDCSGGAGIQADLKTFEAFGVFGQSAVTAVVAENTVGVQGVMAVPPAFVARQIDSCLDDIGADAIKTGMLVDGPTIRAVAAALEGRAVRGLVVDPVMRAKGGDPLIDPEAVRELVARIFPLAAVVTPNVPEAEALVGAPLVTEADFRQAARVIRAMGPSLVVMKGGHNPFTASDVSVDFVWDGAAWTALSGPRSSSRNTHGTGCTFSAAIAANLALGFSPIDAIAVAKRYISRAIASAPGLGRGHGPVRHAVSCDGANERDRG